MGEVRSRLNAILSRAGLSPSDRQAKGARRVSTLRASTPAPPACLGERVTLEAQGLGARARSRGRDGENGRIPRCPVSRSPW